LEKDVEDYAAGKCPAIELWWGKVDAFLAQHSPGDLRRLLDQHDMAAPVVTFQGGLLVSQGQPRREAWEHFERRIALARALEIQTLVIADDVQGPLRELDIERFRLSLRQAAELAAAGGVRLALEFQARSLFCNNLRTAIAMVEEVGSDHLGICLDAFHYEVGPSKESDLGLLTSDNLFHVQVCDLSGALREFATDADRILPGDGDIGLAPIIARLKAIEYRRLVSVELFNPRLFAIAARSFGEIAMTAVRRLLGQASMGEKIASA
jgi:sugar phosphate isomerase/epimerase